MKSNYFSTTREHINTHTNFITDYLNVLENEILLPDCRFFIDQIIEQSKTKTIISILKKYQVK